MVDIDFVIFRFFVTDFEIRLQNRKNVTQSQVIFELLFCWNNIFYHIENLITGSSWYSYEHTCFVYESSIGFNPTPFLHLYSPFLYTPKKKEGSTLGREP